MNRRKKFRPLQPQRGITPHQLPANRDRTVSIEYSATAEISAENSQITSVERIPIDEFLLDRSRTQWQFGDWASLRQLDRSALQHHPDRAKLALLAAAGHFHAQDSNTTRNWIRTAQDWGCGKKIVSQVLISGLHNTLGRAAAVSGNLPWAIAHFGAAVDIGAPHSDRLVRQARAAMQLQQLGITAHIGLIADSNDENPNVPLTQHNKK